MPTDKSEANSQSKPHLPKSQPIGNLGSELSLLKSKSGIGRSSDPVDNPMSYPVHNRIHGLVPTSLVLINVRVCISLEKHLMNHT